MQSEKLASLGVLSAGIVGLRILIEHIVKVVEEMEKITPDNFIEQLAIFQEMKAKIAFYERIELSKKVLEDIIIEVEYQ
ncbi:MAG: hypothetical protein KTR26_21435 [Flammeovirgaceae bacterium]|nr:hypothetical protein [Flammeovirgaceae bacterium]